MPGIPIAKEIKAKVIALRLENHERIYIAKTLNISDTSVGNILREAKLTGKKFKSEKPVDLIDERKRKANEEAKRQEHVQAVKELAFRDFLIESLNKNIKPFSGRKTPHPRSSSKGHERFGHLCLNDWHFEEQVKAEGVLGLNSYNIDTACHRIWRVIHSVIDWKKDMETGGRFTVPKLSITMIGDLLTGTLHGLEKHSDTGNVIKAALACGDILAMAIQDLAETFGEIEIQGVVGNHGRLPDQKKVPTKDPTRSWDYLVYSIARRRLSGYDNIKWHLPEAYGVLFEVGGHLCYAAHGNFIPNNLGVVGYGIRRFTSSLASNLQAANKPLKYAFFGHWHSSNSSEFAGVEAFICPSLIGTQEYSFLSGGAVNRPAQELFIFDKKLGLIDRKRCYGEDDNYDGTYELD